jgi:hypothetical protein
MGKGKVHYIEVVSDRDQEETTRPTHDSDSNSSGEKHPHEIQPHMGAPPHEEAKPRAPVKGGVVATLSGTPQYDTLEIKGVIQG